LLAIVLVGVQPALLSLRKRRIQTTVETFGPLFLVYVVICLRVLLQFVLGARDPATGARTVPAPWGPLLDAHLAALVGMVWIVLAQGVLTLDAFGASRRYLPQLGHVLGAAAVIWASATYPSMRAAGVTASDPYGYTQMAVDIASHGNPIHTF